MPVENPIPLPKRSGGNSTQVEVEVADDRDKDDLIGVRFVALKITRIDEITKPSQTHLPLSADTFDKNAFIPGLRPIKKPGPTEVYFEGKYNIYGGDEVPEDVEDASASAEATQEYPRDPDGFDVYGGDRD